MTKKIALMHLLRKQLDKENIKEHKSVPHGLLQFITYLSQVMSNICNVLAAMPHPPPPLPSVIKARFTVLILATILVQYWYCTVGMVPYAHCTDTIFYSHPAMTPSETRPRLSTTQLMVWSGSTQFELVQTSSAHISKHTLVFDQ